MTAAPAWVGRSPRWPALTHDFRLVVVGAGPTRDRLEAFADDLRVSSRVHFTGAIPDAELYRWLRTARVVVSLPAERSSGTAVTEACAAGTSVVASDLPIHRHAAERVGGGVIFVAPRGSPLDVADAIAEGSQLAVIPNAEMLSSPAASWDAAVDATLGVYEELLDTSPLSEHVEGVREAGFGARPDAWRARSRSLRRRAGPARHRGGRRAIGRRIGRTGRADGDSA